MNKNIFQCEDSTDGIFTGVYDAWASKLGHENIALQVKDNKNFELFAEYRDVETDLGKSSKVVNTLRRRLTQEEYAFLFQASLSKDPDKADAIYRVIVYALSQNGKGPVMDHLSDPSVCKVFELSRNVGNEAHRYLGFVRFQELNSRVLYGAFEPENQLLPIISEHFADRLPNENFILHDKTHEVFTIHEAGKPWGLLSGSRAEFQNHLLFSEKEEEFQQLWKGFCKSISIKERMNTGLQQQFTPLKCRKYMPEFHDGGCKK